MRWLHLIVIALFVAATIVFSIKNFQVVTMSFFGFSARAPLALMVGIIYLLGMATRVEEAPAI
jgi:putative membrane protein